MIHSQETEISDPDNWTCEANNRKSPPNFTGDSPKLKKARYRWQVKNKTLTVADAMIQSQLAVAINGVQQLDGLQEIEPCLDSTRPCCSHSVPNDLITQTTVDNCSNFERSDLRKGELCRSLPFRVDEYNQCATTEVNRAIHGASDDQSPTDIETKATIGASPADHLIDDNEGPCDFGFSCVREDSPRSDSSMIIFVPQLPDMPNRGFNADSTDFPNTQNPVTRSVDPNEPLRYIVMPTCKWMYECSLMRAELDNDINKALERLRYYADQSAQCAQQAYISNRISLETAGIFQVIEGQGLRISSSNAAPQNHSCLRPYCQGQALAVSHLASSATARHNDFNTSSLQNDAFENTEENGIDGTFMSDMSSAGDEPVSAKASSSSSLQSNCPKFCGSSDVHVVNESSSTPSSSFIIDQAVSAVIVEKGIHL